LKLDLGYWQSSLADSAWFLNPLEYGARLTKHKAKKGNVKGAREKFSGRAEGGGAQFADFFRESQAGSAIISRGGDFGMMTGCIFCSKREKS